MGNTINKPHLPDDVIQSIIMRTPTTTIFSSAIYVDKRWNKIGRRNVIWLPRYAELTGVYLNPTDFEEYAVFPLFMRAWFQYPHIWMENGQVKHISLETINVWYDTKEDITFSGNPAVVNYDVYPDMTPVEEGTTYLWNKDDIVLLTTEKRKHPRLYFITRPRGEYASVMEITEMLQIHHLEGLDLLGMKILGEGSYNCVLHREDKGDVLRISVAQDDVIRGAIYVHKMWNDLQEILGPSLLKETEPGYQVDPLPWVIRQDICPKLKNKNGPFYIQGIELLNGKPEQFKAMESAFSILWYFCTAVERIQFRHGDLKPENIVWRALEQDETRVFHYHEKIQYVMTFRLTVPVVIDMDFASLYGDRKHFWSSGTAYTAPPEAIIAQIMGLPLPFYADWWSIGITFFYWWTGFKYEEFVDRTFKGRYVGQVFMDLEKNYSKFRTDKYWMNVGTPNLFEYSMIQHLIGSPPLPPRAMNGPFYTSTKAQNIISEAIQKTKFPPIQLTNQQLNILRDLLSWNSEERGGWKVITENFDGGQVTKKPDYKI